MRRTKYFIVMRSGRVLLKKYPTRPKQTKMVSLEINFLFVCKSIQRMSNICNDDVRKLVSQKNKVYLIGS